MIHEKEIALVLRDVVLGDPDEIILDKFQRKDWSETGTGTVRFETDGWLLGVRIDGGNLDYLEFAQAPDDRYAKYEDWSRNPVEMFETPEMREGFIEKLETATWKQYKLPHHLLSQFVKGAERHMAQAGFWQCIYCEALHEPPFTEFVHAGGCIVPQAKTMINEWRTKALAGQVGDRINR